MSHGIKITDLTSAAALDGTEALPIVQGGKTVKATTAQITTLAQTAMPAANITGTLPVAHGGTGVTIYLGEISTTAGGTITSNAVGSYLFIKCRSATEWIAQSSMGSWTPA